MKKDFDLDYIEQLVKMVSDSELTELTLEKEDSAIAAKSKGNEWDIDDEFYGDSQYDDGDLDFEGYQDLSFDDGSMF